MKINISLSELKTEDDIWNAVLTAYSEYTPLFETTDAKADNYFILFNYFNELESGGHESLLNWFSDEIEKIGIKNYISRLTEMLYLVDAKEYAEIVKNHFEKLVEAFLMLENTNVGDPNGGKLEEDFYTLIEKADSEYYKLEGQLYDHLYKFANKIYLELM